MQVVEDTQSLWLGVATHLMVFEPGPRGEVAYRLGTRPVERAWLGEEYHGRQIPAIVQPSYAAFFDPNDDQLIGLFFERGVDDMFVFCGRRWGDVAVDTGEEFETDRAADLIHSMNTSVLVHDAPPTVSMRFLMNMHNIRHFAPEVIRAIRHSSQLNYLEFRCEAATGLFQRCQLEVLHKHTQHLLDTAEFDVFPVIWPVRPQTGEEIRRAAAARRAPKPQPAKPVKPLTPTLHLDPLEMTRAIHDEPELSRRWQMIVQNLEQADAGRTYHLLSDFTPLIAGHIKAWPARRLIKIFGQQAGFTLVGVCKDLTNEKVLQLADIVAGRESLIDWLDERETDRLMRTDFDALQQLTPDSAREWLNVSPGCSSEWIRKVWRRLLAFINADFGRGGSEKAIHQKKDKIAKRLLAARDCLIQAD
ncbi:hypothetical protein JXA32_03360 [Candidatus Sumerlaeota bacterium]|nr:hypothetical protein [Candidatus Sumerlaeota bacterium]